MKRALLLVLVGCGPLAPEGAAPPAPPSPVHLTDLGGVLGHWSGVDRDAWLYRLTITDGGAFTLTIDRGGGKGGACEEKGTIVLGGDGVSLAFTYASDTCNPAFTGATVIAHVVALPLDLAWPDAIVSFHDDDEEFELRGRR